MSQEPKDLERLDEREVIARGVWKAGGRVLLCRNLNRGYFYLPGGHLESKESARDALRREFLEETGQAVQLGRVLAMAECVFEQSGERKHEINVVFHVEQQDAADEPPSVESREASIAFDWVRHEDLASLDLRPGLLKDWLISTWNDPPEGGGLQWLGGA